MKLIKKTLLALIIIFIFSGVAVWVLTKTVKPTVVNNLINKQLGRLTAQKSHIDGDITWQLFPRPGVKITQIHVGDEDDHAQYSVYIDNLLLNLQITPLLRGKLVFTDLKIDGLNLNIGPEAKTNLEIHKDPKQTTTVKKTVASQLPLHFAIDRFLLTHGKIVIQQPQNKITLTNLQIGASQFNLKKDFFSLQIKTTIAASMVNTTAKASLNYTGQIGLDPSIVSMPLLALQHAAVDGQLLLQNVRFNQFKIAKLSATTITRKGLISLHPLNLSLYNGESTGDLSYQITSQKLTINQTATNLDANQVVKDLFGSNLLKGNLDLSMHTTTLIQSNNWKNNTRGSGNVTVKDGILYFIDINKLVNETTTKIHTLLNEKTIDVNRLLQPAQFTPTIHQDDNTTFQLLSLQYRLIDGKLINDAMLLQTDKLQLKGSGQVDLNDNSLIGNFSAKLITTDNMVDKIQQLLGGSFPLKISGTCMNPLLMPDTQVINPIISRYLLKKTLEKPVKVIQQQIETLLTAPASLLSDHSE